MPPSPFSSRKSKAQTLRDLAVAEAAIKLAKSAIAGRREPAPSSSSPVKKVGGIAAAVLAVAGLVWKRKAVTKLLPGTSSSSSAPATPPAAPPPPQPSNYDAPGPPANTATPIPAPDPQPTTTLDEETGGAFDEEAEIAAAAAEAAAIGGGPVEYPSSSDDIDAGPEEAPVIEAGGGVSEGDELAEADLEENAEFRDDAPSDAQRQIEEIIENTDNPAVGESPETPGVPQLGNDAPVEGAEGDTNPESTPGLPPTQDRGGEEGKDDDWRTWSGRAVDS